MNDIVEAQWSRLLTAAGDPDRAGRSVFVEPYAELLKAAYAHPRLGALFPWTGMWELHFSRCTEQRWTWDIPYIAPVRDGRFAVSGPSRTEFVGYTESLNEAIAMVADRLPAGCGPAFVGTPEELAEHEQAEERR